MSEVFFKREVLRAFPDARLVSIGGPLHRVWSGRANYALSGYKREPKDAWAEAFSDLPKRCTAAMPGQGMLFGGAA